MNYSKYGKKLNLKKKKKEWSLRPMGQSQSKLGVLGPDGGLFSQLGEVEEEVVALEGRVGGCVGFIYFFTLLSDKTNNEKV